jgi:hypothetical protein
VKNRYMAICKKVDRGKDKGKSTPRRYSRAETVSRGSSALSTPVGASWWLSFARCKCLPFPRSFRSASALVAAASLVAGELDVRERRFVNDLAPVHA